VQHVFYAITRVFISNVRSSSSDCVQYIFDHMSSRNLTAPYDSYLQC